MSDTGPGLRALNIWAKREGMCLAILERALELLRTEKNLPESEVDETAFFFPMSEGTIHRRRSAAL